MVRRSSLLLALAAVLVAAVPACGPLEDEAGDVGDPADTGTPTPAPGPEPTAIPSEFEAWCEIDVDGVGTLDLEEDYLPHVIQCENDGAGPEALKAQAVSARSYAYYKIGVSGSVQDGQSDQVYSCNKTPEQRHYDAARATAGQFFLYEDTVVAAFYVAGGNPGDRDACIADGDDPDPHDTEKYVTYNEGNAGSGVEQTTLGWVNPGNHANRGCMSQWGSRCLGDRGDGYVSIGRFYYGEDIGLTQAVGPCVDGSTPSAVTSRRPPVRAMPDVQIHRWGAEQRIGP